MVGLLLFEEGKQITSDRSARSDGRSEFFLGKTNNIKSKVVCFSLSPIPCSLRKPLVEQRIHMYADR